MVGIGTGLNWPQLHTENYSFNDDILPVALKFFLPLQNWDEIPHGYQIDFKDMAM